MSSGRAEAGAPPALAPQADEAQLWTELKTTGSERAREQLCLLYLPFAGKIASRRFTHRGGDIELQDLRQLAFAGLLEAIDSFDPALGSPFKAYASRRITGAILDGITKMSEMREQLSFRNRVRRDRLRSLAPTARTLGGQDAMEALAEIAVGLALGFMLEGSGLYQGGQQDSRTAATAYDSLAWKEAIERVLGELARLPERERMVIERHYLDGLSFDDVAALMGVSKGRVSQLHRNAISLLRKRLPNGREFRLQR